MRDPIINIIKNAVIDCKGKGLLSIETIPPIILEKPRREEFGDFSTNAAMLIAPKEGKAPRKVAEIILNKVVDTTGIIKKFEIAGPGFINIFIDEGHWRNVLKEIVLLNEKFGRLTIGKGKKIQVEFVSANPTGPLHIGHGRGAAVGDTLANILDAAGFEVIREYYINDRGRQIFILGQSVFLCYLRLLGRNVAFPEDFYKGEYIKDIAEEFLTKHGDKYKNVQLGFPECLHEFIDFSMRTILSWIERDIKDFGVDFDVWYSEKTLFDRKLVDKTISELKSKGVIYGNDGATWFRTTGFGDDKDRVLIKNDGSFTYFASDIAYHREKIERGFDTIIDIWGADHHGYESRIRAVLKALGYDDNILKIIFIQLVSLLRNGVPVPMGKREGEFVTLRQVIDEVGRDACRFFFLMRKSDAHLEFDLELAKKQAPENPVFYIQYAHARIANIIKHAEEKGMALPTHNDIDLSLLNQNEEMSIIKTLASFPDIIKDCALSLEPHRLTFYLQELAAIFHPYYNKNRVVSNDIPLSKARLFLCIAVKTVIKNGLSLLKVSAPEVM
ncbi:MAG: arginine--tRNA ligase [Deltaproteobacteria bacterium GWC2_42_11]|nr:MAG: arginine--tRNA ligase [Deltaproteobacteria bacterium GWC2_42_11]